MPQSQIPIETRQITDRFFLAVQKLIDDKQIRGIATLANRWDVSRFSMAIVKSKPDTRRLNLEVLHYLIRDYNVSSEWLMTGKGKMFE